MSNESKVICGDWDVRPPRFDGESVIAPICDPTYGVEENNLQTTVALLAATVAAGLRCGRCKRLKASTVREFRLHNVIFKFKATCKCVPYVADPARDVDAPEWAPLRAAFGRSEPVRLPIPEVGRDAEFDGCLCPDCIAPETPDRAGDVAVLIPYERPFEMAETLVTQRQWREVMGGNPSHFVGDDLPVESVSWFDAVEFCNALSKRDGLSPVYGCTRRDADGRLKYVGEVYAFTGGWRLPTEAEWEFAARGGVEQDPYGPVDGVAWHARNSGGQTHPVAQKLPNAYGLYDMLGNVWEWCWDVQGSYRVIRGGSWFYGAGYCRSAQRNDYSPGFRDCNLGFRPVRSP